MGQIEFGRTMLSAEEIHCSIVIRQWWKVIWQWVGETDALAQNSYQRFELIRLMIPLALLKEVFDIPSIMIKEISSNNSMQVLVWLLVDIYITGRGKQKSDKVNHFWDLRHQDFSHEFHCAPVLHLMSFSFISWDLNNGRQKASSDRLWIRSFNSIRCWYSIFIDDRSITAGRR